MFEKIKLLNFHLNIILESNRRFQKGLVPTSNTRIKFNHLNSCGLRIMINYQVIKKYYDAPNLLTIKITSGILLINAAQA